MTQTMKLGNRVRPLRNVAEFNLLINRLENRPPNLPGMGVFYGPTGYGKTFAAIHAALTLDIIHVSVQDTWTRKTLLKAICQELGVMVTPRLTIPDLQQEVNTHLSTSGRTLVIDEADYAVDRGMIQMIRDFHDGSSMPVVLIGMEDLPQKLRKWELVDGRILDWKAAQPSDLEDAKELAKVYAPKVQIEDALLQHIVDINVGRTRRISVDLSFVEETAVLQGAPSMTLDAWGDAPFLRGEAPLPRKGL
ncbi:ATP-binding protein [Ascidiaceihabitans sp.]|uniref:ATP-binding protein n=1 Tax=Ascidiaceihabitans sp. TaxID=1872644 RepID=UPI0032992BBD